jgi:hypothetical protein
MPTLRLLLLKLVQGFGLLLLYLPLLLGITSVGLIALASLAWYSTVNNCQNTINLGP